MNDNSLLLASGSPRRLDLLNTIGIIPNKVLSTDIDESIKKLETPYEYVKRMAYEKAESAFLKNDSCNFIVAADTIVLRGSKILGKPKNKEEATNFLKLLSGRRHNVLTGFCVAYLGYAKKASASQSHNFNDVKKVIKVVKTSVLVKSLTLEEINWYVSSEEWIDKSGGYAIQGRFQRFVKQINGSVSNIIGLPVFEVCNTLKGLGYKF